MEKLKFNSLIPVIAGILATLFVVAACSDDEPEPARYVYHDRAALDQLMKAVGVDDNGIRVKWGCKADHSLLDLYVISLIMVKNSPEEDVDVATLKPYLEALPSLSILNISGTAFHGKFPALSCPISRLSIWKTNIDTLDENLFTPLMTYVDIGSNPNLTGPLPESAKNLYSHDRKDVYYKIYLACNNFTGKLPVKSGVGFNLSRNSFDSIDWAETEGRYFNVTPDAFKNRAPGLFKYSHVTGTVPDYILQDTVGFFILYTDVFPIDAGYGFNNVSKEHADQLANRIIPFLKNHPEYSN